jgi:peroxiredoxin Q/BCP
MAKKKSKSGRPKAAQKKTAKKSTARAAKKTKKIIKKRPVKKAAKKVVKKAAKKGVKKVVKKGVKKVVKKVVKKTPRKVARQSPPRSVPQAAPPPRAVKPKPVPPPPPPMMPPPAPVNEYGAVVDVVATGPAGGPGVGDVAPDFELRDEAGRGHTLAQYRGQKVILYFYPKDDTPGCTTEACAFRDAADAFRDRNTVVLGVSPDSAESHQQFVQKYGLTFPLLADEGHKTAERYGVWVAKRAGDSTVMGLARTTFVIDASGYVAHVFRDVKPAEHPQEVLEHVPF